MKIVKAELQKLLGNDYNETETFFYNVITVKCPYKVFLTRRAYVLYKLFQNLFGNSVETYGEVYNTHSLPLLKGTQNGKILVIDDIIVHGRTMNHIIEKLEEWNISAERIVLWCIRCNAKACKMDELEKLLKHVIYVMPEQWEKFSDTLTQSIIQSNIGYISYIDSYKAINTSVREIVGAAEKLGVQVLPNNADHFTNCFIESKILWGNFIDKDIVEKYKITPCIRVYEKDTDDGALIIPYVFMPSVYMDQVHNFCCCLLKDLGVNSYPSIFQTNDSDLLVLFYKWTTNKVGQIVLDRFSQLCKDYGNYNLTCNKYFECNESYAFEGDFVDVLPSDDLIEKSIADHEKPESLFECDNIMQSLMSQMKNTQDFSLIFSEYVVKMRSRDNDLAKEGQKRNSGIRISDIIYSIKEKLNSEKEIEHICNIVMSVIIGAWDCGRCAYVIEALDTKHNESIVSCLIRHGEQAFREYYSLHKNVYNVFQIFFKETHEVREPQLVAFAKYFDQLYNQNAFSRFVQNLDFENYYADMKAISSDIRCSENIVPSTNVEEAVKFYIKNYYEG